MSDLHEEMLAIIKKGQAQTDDLIKQNAALIKQNADLISALGRLDIGKSRTRSKESTSPADTDKKSEKCGVCGGPHPMKRCWELMSNKDRRPARWKTRLGKDE